CPVFADIFLTSVRREWLSVLHLVLDVRLVVARSQLVVRENRQRPVNHAYPVTGFRILRFDLNVFLMERLRLFKLPRIIWRASHLKDKRADSVDCAQVLRINIKHAPEFLDRLAPKFLILLTWRAGNVLRSVCGSKIQPRIHQLRDHQFNALELNNCFIILAVLEDLDTLIEYRACLSLILRLRWCPCSRRPRYQQVA